MSETLFPDPKGGAATEPTAKTDPATAVERPPARPVVADRRPIRLRSCDLESLLAQDHRARIVRQYVSKPALGDALDERRHESRGRSGNSAADGSAGAARPDPVPACSYFVRMTAPDLATPRRPSTMPTLFPLDAPSPADGAETPNSAKLRSPPGRRSIHGAARAPVPPHPGDARRPIGRAAGQGPAPLRLTRGAAPAILCCDSADPASHAEILRQSRLVRTTPSALRLRASPASCGPACLDCLTRSPHAVARPASEASGSLGRAEAPAPVVLAETSPVPMSSPAGELDLGSRAEPYPLDGPGDDVRRLLVSLAPESGARVTIRTRSTHVARDADILRALSRSNEVCVWISVPTADERLARVLEPRCPPPAARLAALRALCAAGVPAGLLVAPLLPWVNDGDDDVTALLAAARSAGARFVGQIPVRPDAWRLVRLVALLRREYPRVAARYEVRSRARGAGPAGASPEPGDRVLRIARSLGFREAPAGRSAAPAAGRQLSFGGVQ